MYVHTVFVSLISFVAAGPAFAFECTKIRDASKQVIPAGDAFYSQLMEKVICGTPTGDAAAVVTELVKASCAKDTNLIEEKKNSRLMVACGRYDRRNRLIGFRGPYAELRAGGDGRFHLTLAGRYYSGSRKEKLWMMFDAEEKLTGLEYYEVGVDHDRLTVIDAEGRLIEAGKVRFSQLDDQYYRIGRWKRGKGESDLIYDGKGGQFAIDDLKRLTTSASRQLNIAFSRKRMFYPVQSGRVLLPVSCTKKQSYSWVDSAQSFLQGMKPGESVLVIDRAGNDVPAKLGSLECFTGECGQHVLAVMLQADKPLGESHFAIAQISNDKSGLKTLPEVEAHALINHSEDFYESLAEGTDRYLGVSAGGAPQARVLKAEFSGICCPQATSFTEYDVPMRTKVPKVISTYATPGQPCD